MYDAPQFNVFPEYLQQVCSVLAEGLKGDRSMFRQDFVVSSVSLQHVSGISVCFRRRVSGEGGLCNVFPWIPQPIFGLFAIKLWSWFPGKDKLNSRCACDQFFGLHALVLEGVSVLRGENWVLVEVEGIKVSEGTLQQILNFFEQKMNLQQEQDVRPFLSRRPDKREPRILFFFIFYFIFYFLENPQPLTRYWSRFPEGGRGKLMFNAHYLLNTSLHLFVSTESSITDANNTNCHLQDTKIKVIKPKSKNKK